jgi:hypothetical protein
MNRPPDSFFDGFWENVDAAKVGLEYVEKNEAGQLYAQIANAYATMYLADCVLGIRRELRERS